MDSHKRYALNDYTKQLKKEALLNEATLQGLEGEEVLHLEYNSKKVKPGTLFVCKGANFKPEYLDEAIKHGAIGYVADKKMDIADDVPRIIVSDIRKAMALLAEKFHNEPHKKLKIVGIGGTKGKTTTTYYIKSILDAYLEAEGKAPAGLISTINNFTGGQYEESTNTTPEAMDLQELLAESVDAGLEYLVMEVSSQALKYHRTDRVEFDVSIFLNIDEDHISPIEHPNFADYLESKAKMFAQTNQLVINKETREAEYLFGKAEDAKEYFSFSLDSKEADYYAYDIETIDLESHFKIHSDRIEEDFVLGMPGRFNIENALAAAAAIDLLGIPVEYTVQALKDVKVPGRMTIFSTKDKQIIAIADYAHNRLSFENLITSMQKTYPEYKVLSILGAPGGKAFGRREELGSVAGEYSDYVYITTDDPGSEKVSDISEEIAQYVEIAGTPYALIEDREAAIHAAFERVEEKTLILAIGKGHETIMRYAHGNVPMKSDEAVMEELIESYNQKINSKS